MAMVVSSPMRSARCKGPIGWAQPLTMPRSMSSAVAKPDSSMRIAERRYGISSALTMKPARSWDRMTCFSSWSAAKRSAVAAVSSLVKRDVTSSTSGSTGTGLKKWIPMTWLGRLVAMASFMIGMEEVFEARMATGSSTILSRDWNTATFSDSDSTTASMTS